jgi:hypothetical protein
MPALPLFYVLATGAFAMLLRPGRLRLAACSAVVGASLLADRASPALTRRGT